MALGRPVVATSGSGFEEIIAAEESGFLVEPGNSEALARKISECLDDAARLSRVSEGAVRRARDFDASRIAAGLLDYYHEVQGAWQARRMTS
jgi:glycosyltransferase involved in cell wall biosynthesis